MYALQFMEIALFYESICVHFPFTMTREFGLAGEGGGVVLSSVFISIYHDKRVWVGRRGWRGCFIICVHFHLP